MKTCNKEPILKVRLLQRKAFPCFARAFHQLLITFQRSNNHTLAFCFDVTMGTDILTDTLWDIVICGTGLPQALLALSLSRSGKNILHIDPNEYYGGAEAALTLQDADDWVAGLLAQDAVQTSSLFRDPSITKNEAATGLSNRGYSLALAPQLIHARSELLSQLVSSRAAQQVDFLAVGSFFILKSDSENSKHNLMRIPSTREDVFSTTALSMKAKRALMKFLKFVMDYKSAEHVEIWKPHEDVALAQFLEQQFKMDVELRSYIIALTLSLDGGIGTKEGLAVIHRHLTSMGVFGPGFAAVYPKWGGLAEIAQVACRSGAVGGAVYMLGTGIKGMTTVDAGSELELTTGDKIKTRLIVRGNEGAGNAMGISRLVAVISSPLKSLFTATVEGAPIPAVAVVAFPTGSLTTVHGTTSASPVYVFAHSSDTGECPPGQSVLYLTTQSASHSRELLTLALEAFIISVDGEAKTLYTLCYEQTGSVTTPSRADDLNISMSSLTPSLAFDDAILNSVHDTWRHVVGDVGVDTDYMTFPDRNGAMDDDDNYE